MHILALLVSVNVLLFVIFRLFKTYKVDTFQAIVFNYFTCMVVGSITLGRFPLSKESIHEPWFPYSIVLGLLFISGFNILAKTVQNIGVTLASVAQKMSLVISVSFTLWYFSESLNALKIIGFIAAFLSIILVNLQGKNDMNIQNGMRKHWHLFLATLILSGIIEAVLFYVEAKNYSTQADIGFVVSLFGIAGIIGASIVIGGYILGKLKFSFKNVLAGIILGIPNFFTIYLLLVLISKGYEGSQIFPIINVSIILVSAIVGVLAFKEKLNKFQWLGFSLGVICILLILNS